MNREGKVNPGIAIDLLQQTRGGALPGVFIIRFFLTVL
jgi:hypothetical protein